MKTNSKFYDQKNLIKALETILKLQNSFDIKMFQIVIIALFRVELAFSEENPEESKSPFVFALKAVVAENFQNTFNFVVLEDNNDSLKDSSHKFLRMVSGEFSISVFTDISKINVRRDSLILINSVEKLKKIFTESVDRSFDFQKQFLVALTGASDLSEIKSVFDFFWRKKILDVRILFSTGSSIFLATYHPFTKTSCSDTNPIIINQSSTMLS